VRGNPHKPVGRPPALAYLGRRPASYEHTFSMEMARLAAAHASRADAVIAMEVGAAVYFDDKHPVPLVFEEAEGAAIQGQIAAAPTRRARLARTATWWKYGRYLARAVRHFDATTVVSEAEMELLVAAGAPRDRIAVVPNGVDLPERAHSAARVHDRLVYAGAPTYWANLEAVRWFAAEVQPHLRAAGVPARLHVTGATGGVDLAELRDVGVVFEGHQPDVRGFVAASAVAVVPIRSGGGTRLKVLEAMALGTPVVSTTKGAEGLDVRDGEHLLIADDGADFAAAVRRLFGDASLRTRLASAAATLVAERYTWARAGRLLGDALDAAVERFRRSKR
jgi:polysaccharide biosynthesis protein PslH